METGANITAAVFAAYLKCRTKAYLTVHGEKPLDPVFAEMRKRISAAYKAIAGQRAHAGPTVPIDFSRLADGVMGDGATAPTARTCAERSSACERGPPLCG